MRVHFKADQDLGKKRFDAFSEQKVHYKMFKAGKDWLYAGIFMLSLGAGMLGIGGTVGYADTVAQDNATSTTNDVKPTADTGSYTLQATSNSDQSAANTDTSTISTDNSANQTTNTDTTSDTSASVASSKNVTAPSSATEAAKASTAVAPDSASTTPATTATNTKEAAKTTDDNSTSNTAAAQQSSAAISSTDKPTAPDTTDAATVKTASDGNNAAAVTDGAPKTDAASTDAATLKATATSVKPANQKLDTSALTDASANTYASLQQMKTATAGMTQEELISYVSAHNNAAKAANGGTIFVVSDSGDIIQMTAKADLTYTANYTFKDEAGNDVAAPETKTSTLANAAQAIVEPPYVPGYQLDMDASQLHVVQANKTGMSDTASITDYMKNLNTIISAAGGLIDNVQLNSFQDLLNVFAAMNGVDQQASGVIGSLFQDVLSPATSQTGTFNYVYKKSDSTIQTQTQTVNVGDPVPAMSSFITTAKDVSGKDISADLTSPDYANLSTQTTGDKTFTVEYFNMTNLEFIQAQATLKVAEKATKDVVSVDNKTITYGDDVNGKGSDIGLTISDNGTDLTMPTLTATDYHINGAQYTASGHLAAGTYTIKLNNDGFKKVALANPDMLLDPLTNFKNGKLTVNKATATFTATSATKEVGTQDPTLGYTVTGAANGDTLGATVTREAGDTAGEYKVTVTPTNLDTANYTAKINDGTFTITPKATNSTITLDGGYAVYGNDDNYGIRVTASDSDVKIPTLTSSDFTVQNATYSKAGHLNAGNYTVTLSDSGINKIKAANPNVALSADAYGTGTLTIAKSNVIISAQNMSKAINTPDPTWNIAISGQASNEKVDYTVSRTPGEGLGTFIITPSFDPNTEINKNYNIRTVPGILTITAAATEVHFVPNAASVGYGDLKLTKNADGNYSSNYNFGITSTGELPAGTMPVLTASDYEIVADDKTNFTDSGNLKVNEADYFGYIVLFTKEATQKIMNAFPNYSFQKDTFSSNFLRVTKKTVQITPNSVSKQYNSPDSDYSYTTSSPIVDSGIDVTITRADPTNSNAGVYELTAHATDDPNYNFTYGTGTLTITKAPSTDTLTIGNAQMTYGDTSSQFTTQHVGGQLTIPTIPQSDYTIINGQYTNGRLNVGTYDVALNAAAQQLINDANKDSNYELPTIKSGKLTVVPKAVTLTADNLSKAMGSTDPALTATDNGQLLAGDSLNYTVTRAPGETMGTYTETIKLGNNQNYNVTTVPGTFTITGKLTATSVNLTDGTTTYGDLNQDVTKDSYTFNSYLANNALDKLVLPDGLTNADYVIQNATYSPSGYLNQGTYTVGLSDSGIAKVKAANKDFDLHDANFIAGTIVVTPATLTVTPQSVSKDAGQPDPTTWTTSVSGALVGDTPAVTGYTVTRSNTSETPGKYVISADVSQATVNDSNYVLAGGDAILTINPKTTTDKIVVTPTGITYGDDTTGYVVIGTNGSATATNGFKVTATVQGGNDLVVPDFDASDFTIAHAQLSASGHLNAGSYGINLTAAGLAKIKAANPDYVINADGSNLTLNQFTVAKKTATITADNQSKVYGTADPQLTYKTAGVVDGDDIGAVTVTRATGDNIGTYAITPSAGDNANYDFKYVNGTLTITALALTGSATVTAQQVTYGSITKNGDIIKGRDGNIEGDNAFGITLEGHTLDTSTLTPADYTIGATDTDHNGNYLDAGSYTVTLNDAGKAALAAANPNYDFSKVTFTDGSLTVAQESLYLNIFDKNKIYGQPDPMYYPTVAGLVFDDESHNSVNITVNREPGEDVGTYTITPVLAIPSRNYKVAGAGHATLTITPATISASDVDMQVKPNDQTITYGQTPAGFDATFGKNLNKVDLSNSDFIFTSKKDGSILTSVPTDVDDYTVSLTADAQTAIAKANTNYTFTADAFKTGTFSIKPIVTTPGDKDTEITANNAAIIHGQATPDFNVSYGAKVKDAGLTQDDFTVNNTVASSTDVPTAVGNYTLTLNESGINKIKAANPTFAFSAGDFIAGTYKIVEATTTGTLTVNTTYTGAPKPASYPEQQTVDLTRTATVDNNGQVTYGDWTAQNVSDGNLVTALTTADVPVPGYTVAVSGDTGAYTLADFTNATSGADASANVVLNRAVTYTTKTFSTGTPGQDGDPEGTQAQYLAGIITVTQTNNGDYTKPVGNQTVNVSRTATLDSNGNVVYSDWTTDGTNEVLVPELTNDGAAVKGYTDTVTGGAAYTSDNFKAVSDAVRPGDKGYTATVARTVNYKLNQNEYTQGSAGDPAKNDPEGTQAKYLTGTITVSQTNTGDYTKPFGNQTVNVSRTATLDKNGNVVYSDWTTDGTNKTLVNALTSADVNVPGFTATVENGAAYTSDNFKAVSDAGKPGDKGYTATVARTVNYKLNQNEYNQGSAGDPAKNDPEGTQAKYLTGTITVSQQNNGDYTKDVANTTVNVSRTATLDKNGNVVYGDWTIDGTNKVLVPELTDTETAVKGYTNTITNGASYTSDNFKAVSDAGQPGDNGYVATVARTVNYKLNQTDYTKGNPGDPTKNDPEGTQAKYLTGTITVSQTNTGDYTKPVGNQTFYVSRTAALDKNGNVVYSDWTTDGTNEVLVPELTTAETTVKGYTNTVTNGASYTSDNFKTVTDADQPGDNGYVTTVSRTVNYKLNQPEYTKENSGDPTKNDPEGTQAKYLTGIITVTQQNTGDYTKPVGNITVNVSRTATLDKNGNVVYSDWTTDGTNEILVPELTNAGAAVKGYTDTVTDGAAYTSDNFKAVTAAGTPGDKGYVTTVSRTVNYTKHTYTTGTPGGTDDPAGTQAAYLTGKITINRTNTGDYTATVAPIVVNVTREASLDANGNVVYSAWSTDGTADWTANGANVILVPALTDAAAAVKGYTDSVTQGDAYTSGMFNAKIGSNEPDKVGYKGTVSQVVNYAYNQTITNDPDGGKTIIKTDGSGQVVQIEKDWPDGDKTVGVIQTTSTTPETSIVTVTETPKGEDSLPPITVEPGKTATTGKTTVTNDNPGVTLTHHTPGQPGTTGEVVTGDGQLSYTKTAVPDAVSTTKDNYFTTTTTPDPDGGKTTTKVDGSGSVTEVTKDWSDGDKTVAVISTTTDTDNKTTSIVTVTETPSGKDSLPPITVGPNESKKTGKTTVTNTNPGVTLIHDVPGTDNTGTPTTDQTGTTVTPDGAVSYFKVAEPVSTTQDAYYVTTTTPDPDGGKTTTKVDGSGEVTEVIKNWSDGDQTVAVIDTNTDTDNHKTSVVTVTETPSGEASLPPVTVEPGKTVTTGKTTVTNDNPGVTLTHQTPAQPGNTGEVVTGGGEVSYTKMAVPDPTSVSQDDFYRNTTTADPDGGKTTTKVDGSGAVTEVIKDWPDGDKTVAVIDTNTDTDNHKTSIVTVTETPSGEASLPPLTVEPGQTVTTGKTTVTNDNPGVTLTHETPAQPGTTGEVITGDGTLTYTKTAVPEPVSVTQDDFYQNTTTNDPDGGKTITKVDGGGAVTGIDKTWPDGDQTVVTIDKTGDATFTETPKGQPSLPTQTVKPGETATAGKTTLTNNEPKGVDLTHQPTNGPSTTETVAPNGSRTISTTGEPVSVDPDDYYNNTNTNTAVDGGGAVDNPATTPDDVPDMTPTVTPAGNGQTTATTGSGTGVQSSKDGSNTGINKGTGVESNSGSTNGSSTNTSSAAGGASENTGMAQGQTADNSQAAAAGTNGQVSDQTQKGNKQGQLPQTNEKQNAAGATIGLGLLGLLAALGFKRKKRDDE